MRCAFRTGHSGREYRPRDALLADAPTPLFLGLVDGEDE
jgi:hypothetical protein